jgi:uridylate kinase
MAKYKRILLKLSGESLAGSQQQSIDNRRLTTYARQIGGVAAMGVQIGIVIGGGNIFRGLSGAANGFDRVKGDQMGMLATVINSLALDSALKEAGIKSQLLTAIRMEPVGQFYTREKALEALEKGKVIILAGGTGNPYFTTDTASALRAVEIQADIMMKGTRVDGIYTADPELYPEARKIETITFREMYKQNLKIMDLTATTLCMEQHMPVLVFNMDTPGNLEKAVKGEKIGSIVSG